MAIIKLNTFGGESPSASDRAIAPGMSRIASNVYPRIGEFRPLAADVSYTPSPSIISNALSLFRFTRNSTGVVNTNMTQNWVSSATPTNYARGMVDDDLSERTYVTSMDGTTEPVVMDNSGYSKTLGVPAPAVKPTVSNSMAGEFTAEEEAIAKKVVPLQVFEAVRKSLSNTLFGTAPPMFTTPGTDIVGWIAHNTTGYTGVNPATSAGQFAFLLKTTTSGGVTSVVSPYESYTWIFNAALGGNKLVHTASGTEYWAIPYFMQAPGHLCNPNTLRDALETIPNPSTGVVGADAAAWLNLASGLGGVLKTQFLGDSISAQYLTVDEVRSSGTYTAVKALAKALDDLKVAQDAIPLSFISRAGADAATLATGVSLKEMNAAKVTAAAQGQADLTAAVLRVQAEFDAINIRIADTVRDQNFWSGGIAPLLPAVSEHRPVTTFYVTTLVTAWGEESAPSPPTDLLTVNTDDVITVSRPTELASAPTIAKYGLVGWRLYRSNTGSSATAFQLVTEVDTVAWPNVQLTGTSFDYFKTAMTTYADDKEASELGEVLPTADWLPPPTLLKSAVTYYLAGITSMTNGVMAAFLDNNLCFCEAYCPYAWPIEAQLTVKYRIVGLGAMGQSLIVLTTGSPYLCSGADARSMSLQEMPTPQSCVSARSIASVENGVLYASPDGLCLASLNGVQVVTEGLFSREDWNKLVPSSIIGAYHDGVYFFKFSGTTTDGVSGAGICYALDFVAKKLTRLDLTGTAFFNDTITDTLYLVNGSSVLALFSHASNKRTGNYKTGIVSLDKQQPLAWLQVNSDFSTTAVLKWYGDGALRHTVTLSNETPVRLPPGRYLDHQIELTTSARVTGITLAGSVEELQSA